MANKDRMRVALLLGGDSSEREVSFMSGKAMANALPRERFAVTIFDVASPATRASHGHTGGDALGKKPLHAYMPVEWNQLTTTLYTGGFDVVLPALHGGWGEDGTLQALLEVAGIPYVGSPAHASTIAIDKQVCKAALAEYGIPVPRGKVINSLDELEEGGSEQFFFNTPVVIKPNGGGSSVGVTILREAAGSSTESTARLRTAVAAALEDGNGALIEELIEGVEVTAAVLGEGKDARVLPLLEIVPHSEAGFYDFEAKYLPGGSQHITPPRLEDEVQQRVTEYALRAHCALGCRGVARSDFIVSGDGTPYFLEINTLPGMTQTSLVPDAAAADGISFEELIETLITQTLQRPRNQAVLPSP